MVRRARRSLIDALGSFRNPLENPDRDPELKNGKSVVVSTGRGPFYGVWQDGKILDPLGTVAGLSLLGY